MNFAVTIGILGIFAWVLFIVYAHIDFTRVIWLYNNTESNIPILLVVILASYGLATLVLYTPGPVPLAITALLSGAGIALAYPEQIFVRVSSRWRAIVFPVIIIFTIGIILFGFIGVSKRLKVIQHYQKGIVFFQSGKTREAIKETEAAVNGRESDLFERGLSEMYQKELDEFLKRGPLPKLPKDDLDTLVKASIGHALRATELNPGNYLNFIALGNVYTRLALSGVSDLAKEGTETYKKAIIRNPTSPASHFLYGQFLAITGNRRGAIAELNLALGMRPGYKDADDLLQNIINNTPPIRAH